MGIEENENSNRYICDNPNCEFRTKCKGVRSYFCPFQDKYYHLIRRINKFYENLLSVQHLLETEKKIIELNKNIEVDHQAMTVTVIDSVNQQGETLQEKKESSSCDIKRLWCPVDY